MKVVDMHCDTACELLGRKRKGLSHSLQEPELHISLDKMEKGDYLLQNFALFVSLGWGRDPYEEALAMADCLEEALAAFPDRIRLVRSFGQIEENRRAGRICAMLTVEEGGVCQGSLEKLEALYDRGVRMLTLTWNYQNEIGWPNVEMPLPDRPREGWEPDFSRPQTKKGLTEFGIRFVERMEALGMIVDVSHLSDAGFYEVLKHTRRPFVASHSNARAVCPHVRNMTDDMIRCLARRGGVMGLNYCPDFLTAGRPGERNEGTIEAVVAHAKHIVKVGGEDCLGLGSDFDGIPTHRQLPGADCLPLLEDALRCAGFTALQREKIFSGNVLRLYREVLG